MNRSTIHRRIREYDCRSASVLVCVVCFGLVGCGVPSDGSIMYTVDDFEVYQSGRIVLSTSRASGRGWSGHVTWLRTDGESLHLASGSKYSRRGRGGGGSWRVLTTSDPASVRLLVAQGEWFIVKPGMEKTILEFAAAGEPDKVSRLVFEVLTSPDDMPPGPPFLDTHASSVDITRNLSATCWDAEDAMVKTSKE